MASHSTPAHANALGVENPNKVPNKGANKVKILNLHVHDGWWCAVLAGIGHVGTPYSALVARAEVVADLRARGNDVS
jgi:hypothetical protein